MIKYEKTTWVDGETVLKADHMKKIEKGIVDLCTEIENITLEGVDLKERLDALENNFNLLQNKLYFAPFKKNKVGQRVL